MLTKSQKTYLSRLSTERAEAPVIVESFDPQTQVIAERVMSEIRAVLPDADIRFMGASALSISGQNDIDIYILYSEGLRTKYEKYLTHLLGQKKKRKWKWVEGGYEISVKLSNPKDKKFKEQLDIFKIFTTRPETLKEYESLKKSMNGKSYKEYQTAKYKFYNNVLGIA